MTTFQPLPVPADAPRITEVKRRLDGSEARFACELVARTASLVVALFRFDGSDGQVDSYGLFWPRRPYLVYHMVPRAPGAPVRTRFDVVRDMRLGPDEVSYTDLLLDLWVEDGVPRWEDDDEVDEALRLGRLDPRDHQRIERTRALLARRHGRVIAEVRRTLAGFGRPGG